MAILDTAIQQERDIKSNLKDIKDAVVEKGAVIPEGTDLNQWADRIRAIPVDLVEWTISDDGVGQLRARDTITIPQAIEGTPLSTTLKISGDALRTLVASCRRLVIPEYFQTVQNPQGFISGFPGYIALEEIEYGGTGALNWDYLYNYPNIWRVSAPNMTAAYNLHVGGRNAERIVVDIPNAISATLLAGTGENPIPCEWNVQSATTLGSGGYQPPVGRYWYGTVEAPRCTTINGINQPDTGATVYKLPALTTLGDWSFWYTAGTGTIDIYIGPSLTTIGTSNYNNPTTQLINHADKFRVHIPAGDSTTKTTLDSAGITYTQDYVI